MAALTLNIAPLTTVSALAQDVAPSAAPVLVPPTGKPASPAASSTPETVPADNAAATNRTRHQTDSIWQIALLLAAFGLVALLSRLRRRP